MEYSGILHLMLPIFQSLYCFITKRNWFDIFYIYMIFIVCLHWSFYNGECVISYWYKKKLDPEYIAGQDVNSHDFSMLFNPSILYVFSIISNILIMYNLYIIFKRNKIPLYLVYTFILISQSYFFGLKLFDEPYKNNTYLFFQEIYKYILILWGIVFLYTVYY
jgi:hypothetical protein